MLYVKSTNIWEVSNMNSVYENLERQSLIEDLQSRFNSDTVSAIMEAIEDPASLHRLNSWEELGL